MKKKYVLFAISVLLCLSGGLSFLQPEFLAKKVVELRIYCEYRKEVKEIHDLIYEQLEAQNATDMIDTYMDLEIAQLQYKYYEGREPEVRRFQESIAMKSKIKTAAAITFFVGVIGMVSGAIWKTKLENPTDI